MTSPVANEISHVSDTALMVAACRALETELEDAFVRDPFAGRLAGDRGFAILNAVQHSEMMRLGLAIRTRVIDDLLNETLAANPVNAVLSVGCGLDTRPWRLNLPSDLRWIEVDFQDMLDYKHNMMAEETPQCRVERISVDLNDGSQRPQMYEAVGSAQALMITEGLLLYLPATTVEALIAEVRHHTGVAHWISDITTSAFSVAIMGTSTLKSVDHVRAADSLKGEEILEVFHRSGWAKGSWRSYVTDVEFAQDRVHRMMGGVAPPPLHISPDDPTGAHCFARVS
jgi:methyltransferase (TIGR00027 family)